MYYYADEHDSAITAKSKVFPVLQPYSYKTFTINDWNENFNLSLASSSLDNGENFPHYLHVSHNRFIPFDGFIETNFVTNLDLNHSTLNTVDQIFVGPNEHAKVPNITCFACNNGVLQDNSVLKSVKKVYLLDKNPMEWLYRFNYDLGSLEKSTIKYVRIATDIKTLLKTIKADGLDIESILILSIKYEDYLDALQPNNKKRYLKLIRGVFKHNNKNARVTVLEDSMSEGYVSDDQEPLIPDQNFTKDADFSENFVSYVKQQLSKIQKSGINKIYLLLLDNNSIVMRQSIEKLKNIYHNQTSARVSIIDVRTASISNQNLYENILNKFGIKGFYPGLTR